MRVGFFISVGRTVACSTGHILQYSRLFSAHSFLSSVRFGSVQFGSVQFSSVQFSSVQFSSVRLQATRGILISTARVNLNKFLILIIKPTRCTYFSNLFLEKTLHVSGQLLCPSSGVFHCTHSNGICHTGLLKACTQD